jgi:microcystin-dependent protein
MSTHDYVINNQTAPAFRSDLNNALAAIATNNSGSSAPSTTYGGLWWFDTSANLLKIRNAANSAWVVVGEFDVANSRFKLISDSLKAASAGGIDIFDSSGAKILDLAVASEATAQAGTNNTEIMTPLRVAQAVPLPSGMITPYGGTSAPSNWLLCHGQSLSTSTYAALHTAIGFTYGGSGSAFNVPDLRGRVIAGQDDMGGSSANRLTSPINGDTLGAAGGSESHALTLAETAAHNHFLLADATGGTSYPTASQYVAKKGDWGSVNSYQASGTATGATLGLSSTAGSSTAHNNVQPTLILNYIIKT